MCVHRLFGTQSNQRSNVIQSIRIEIAFTEMQYSQHFATEANSDCHLPHAFLIHILLMNVWFSHNSAWQRQLT